jgi:hypothetical protein
MSEAIPQVIEPCPSCGRSIDVTGQEPFASVACPHCGRTMRARVHFHNFTLLELLGEGGMGSVFKAVDNNLQRRVALKILKRSAGSTEEDWKKLAAEARLTAAVNHPNVVKVFTFGEDHGQFYLAMELVEKGSLDGLMVLQTRVSEAQALDIGIQIAEGLQAAYEHGLIHRDIKPGNILFATQRHAKIVDFGLARILSDEAQEQGEIWGTPFYVAPEKLDGRPEDFRSDIYSLGGTLFHALAGRPPFDARTASMVVLKHIKSQAVSLQAFAPNVSDETAYVINRMLHKDPEERYQSYEELLTHLHYARQKLQKRSAQLGGATVRAAVKARTNRPVLVPLWTVAGLACVAVALATFLPRLKPGATARTTEAPRLLAEGRQALSGGKVGEARAKFQAALVAAGSEQPLRNWARAQLGLAVLMGGGPAREVYGSLEEEALFNMAPAPQALGRFFRKLAAGGGSASLEDGADDFRALVLLTDGLRAWNEGNIEMGGALIDRFVRGKPGGSFAWIAELKPAMAAYVADFRAYNALRAAADAGGDGAGLVARLEQAKAAAKTGAPFVAKLDALADEIRAR